MQEQFIRLAEVLAAIDRQSELLKSLIEEKWFPQPALAMPAHKPRRRPRSHASSF
jgi:hypothetical protein